MIRSFLLSIFVPLLAACSSAQQDTGEIFRFAVSGDSRNCGDVVMPGIAESALKRQVDFYWHLGDFRLMGSEKWGGYKGVVDDDMCQQFNGKPCGDKVGPGELSPDQYRKIAWGDFIAHQVAPFGNLPVFLGIGNHEMYKDGDSDADQTRSHEDFATQFAYWLHRPEIEKQRLPDFQFPQDAAYYDWKQRPVDFVYLDNSLETGFGATQLLWLRKVLDRDKKDQEVRAIVVGMHRALPNSFSCGHSMNGDASKDKDSPEVKKQREKLNRLSLESGLEAYQDLVKWQKDTGKLIYVLASHSHLYMANVFNTAYWQDPENGGEVLPGWIVGTAGARRYLLPPDLDNQPDVPAKTYAYGYLLGSVKKDGHIDFEFEELTERDIPEETRETFGNTFVDFCFYANRDNTPHPPPDNCGNKAGANRK